MPTMRSTESLPTSCLLLGLVPRPTGVTPRAAIGDRGRSVEEMKKIRGKKRRLNAFSRQLDDEVASFPSEGRSGCGYWHLHMPCAQSFIDHSPNPTRLRKDCVKAILKTTLRLRLVKPEDVDARVVCCLSWPSLWDSQIIVVPRYFQWEGGA